MKNFAMLYKMKEALQDFRANYNRLDPEWQEWIKYEIGQGYIEDIQDAFTQLENLELDKLDIKPFEVEAILDIRRQGE